MFDVIVTEGDDTAIGGGVTVNGSAATASFPIFSEFPNSVEVTPGTELIKAGGRMRSLELPAGDYGKIRVGRDAVLQFTGGVYNIDSLRAGYRANLSFRAATTLNINGRFKIGRNARFGPAEGDGMSPLCVTVNVGEGNGVVGATSSNAKIHAAINAPGRTVRLGRLGEFRGRFVADVIALGDSAVVSQASPCL